MLQMFKEQTGSSKNITYPIKNSKNQKLAKIVPNHTNFFDTKIYYLSNYTFYKYLPTVRRRPRMISRLNPDEIKF